MASDFRARVLAVVRRIPPGRVTTYGDVAVLAGAPRAARAVGTVMRNCRDPRVPCHRVIAAGGGLGGYGAFLHIKRDLLRKEGLNVGMTRVRRFTESTLVTPRGERRASRISPSVTSSHLQTGRP